MGRFNDALASLLQILGKTDQNDTQIITETDYYLKGEKYSVEAEISEALADLMLMFSTMPISGETERAKWLDDVSDKFYRLKAKTLIASSFGTGDALVVPSWNGRNIQNVIADANNFAILENVGEEITACAYVVDRKIERETVYTLMQAIELVPYSTGSGKTYANRYRMFVVVNDSLSEVPLSRFPEWAGKYEPEWYIPNVDRLLIGRYKSFTMNTRNPNSVMGVPICFGAGEHIQRLHYLLDQMQNEFKLSEKAIIADKRLFQKEKIGNITEIKYPKGLDRLFMSVSGFGDNMTLKEWSPEIRYVAYLDAIDKVEHKIECSVGVSGGIISSGNDVNYQNVDNVRKSQQKTMGFISTARKVAEDCFSDLVYAWDTIANYYGVVPIGNYEVSFDWSNEYIETFADKQNAILAGIPIGATDAVDYRMQVLEESPEAAREKVAEIAASLSTEPDITDISVTV